MTIHRLTTRSVPALLTMLSVMPCQGAGVSERVPIAVEQVAGALRAAALPIEGAAVRMQVRMSSASAAPVLKVTSVEPWGDQRAQVRVACVDHAECLPFYVAVEWVDAPTARAAFAAVRTPSGGPARSGIIGSSKPLEAPLAVAAAALANPQPAGSATPVSPAGLASMPSPVGAHAGARAILRLTGPRIHIDVPVICLEAGAPGHSIRVAAADHKQNYVAEVVDPTLLKGTL